MVKPTISLIIPAYNEQKALSLVLDEALPFVDEIIVVDDGSRDRTFHIAKAYSEKHKKIKTVKHAKNAGKVAALRTGVRNSSGSIIVFTDADCTYPASVIPRMVENLEKGFDLVLGNRFTRKGKRNIPVFNKIGNKFFSLVASYITCVTIIDGQTGLRAFWKNDYRDLDVNAKGLEYETEMTVRAAKLGYRIKEIPIDYRRRVGKSKLRPVHDGMQMLLSLIYIASSETSILAKFIIYPSILSFLIGTSLGIISIKEFLIFGEPLHPYYPMLTVLFMFIGLQLFSLGLIIDNLTKKLSRIEERIIRK